MRGNQDFYRFEVKNELSSISKLIRTQILGNRIFNFYYKACLLLNFGIINWKSLRIKEAISCYGISNSWVIKSIELKLKCCCEEFFSNQPNEHFNQQRKKRTLLRVVSLISSLFSYIWAFKAKVHHRIVNNIHVN